MAKPKPFFNKSSKRDTDTIRALLDDIELVGEKKLLGYLPLSTIRDICHEDPHVLQSRAEAKGLKTLLLKSGECDIASGALYVYDPVKLQEFLLIPQNKAILEQNGWPVAVDGFVNNVVRVLAKDEALYDLIALAFSDKRPCYQDYAIKTPKSPVPWKPF